MLGYAQKIKHICLKPNCSNETRGSGFIYCDPCEFKGTQKMLNLSKDGFIKLEETNRKQALYRKSKYRKDKEENAKTKRS